MDQALTVLMIVALLGISVVAVVSILVVARNLRQCVYSLADVTKTLTAAVLVSSSTDRAALAHSLVRLPRRASEPPIPDAPEPGSVSYRDVGEIET